MKSVWSRPGVRGLLIVLAALVAPACAGGAVGGAEDGVPAASRQAFVEVQNNNWADIVVYAVRYGVRTRLGMVTSMGRERFALPPGLIGGGADLQLVADPIGGEAPYAFPPVMVEGGQRVEVRVENNLRLSSVAVW